MVRGETHSCSVGDAPTMGGKLRSYIKGECGVHRRGSHSKRRTCEVMGKEQSCRRARSVLQQGEKRSCSERDVALTQIGVNARGSAETRGSKEIAEGAQVIEMRMDTWRYVM